MAPDSVALVRRAYEAWNGSQPVRDFGELVGENFEFVNPDYAVEAGTRRGIVGAAGALASVDAAFAEYTHELNELVDAGDTVLAFVTFKARGHGGGVEVQVEEQHIWTVEDGKIVRVEWFHDRRAALDAAGLTEEEVRRQASR
jgi:ketosteroid isomerase-like protein